MAIIIIVIKGYVSTKHSVFGSMVSHDNKGPVSVCMQCSTAIARGMVIVIACNQYDDMSETIKQSKTILN